MPPLTFISAFRRTDANGGSRGEAMPERENIKQRVSESRAKRVWTLPSGSCFDRRSNNVKREQNRRSSESHQACLNGRVATEENRNVNMTEFLGHFKDLITLSPSLSLRYSPTVAYTLLRFAGDRALIYGFSCIRAREAALFFIPESNYVKLKKSNL